MASPNPYERLVERLGHRRWFAWFGRKILTPLDLKAEGHRLAPTTLGTHFPLCYLTVIGARSGLERTVPLLYVTFRDEFAVAATNFGSPVPPDWSINLDHNPAAVLHIDDGSFAVRARRASESEADDLWPMFDNVWSPFATYRRRARRAVPIHLLARTTD